MNCENGCKPNKCNCLEIIPSNALKFDAYPILHTNQWGQKWATIAVPDKFVGKKLQVILIPEKNDE